MENGNTANTVTTTNIQGTFSPYL